MVSAQAAKEAVLSTFWKGSPVQFLEESGRKYSRRVDALLRREASQAIRYHQESGDVLVLVTASVKEWVEPWAKANGFHHVIASELEIQNGIVTGKLHGNNCTGLEKVSRIRAIVNLDDFDEIFVYGDSKGDREMLALGSKGKKFYKWRVVE